MINIKFGVEKMKKEILKVERGSIAEELEIEKGDFFTVYK